MFIRTKKLEITLIARDIVMRSFSVYRHKHFSYGTQNTQNAHNIKTLPIHTSIQQAMFPPPHSVSVTADEDTCLLMMGVFSLMSSASKIRNRFGLSDDAMMSVLSTSCFRVRNCRVQSV